MQTPENLKSDMTEDPVRQITEVPGLRKTGAGIMHAGDIHARNLPL